MKKLLTLFAVVLAMGVSSCSKFDDSAIWEKFEEQEQILNDHEKRISALEELCKQMNTNISALQTLVEALEKNDYITNVSPIAKDGIIIGYTITFVKSGTITIYNGEDGKNGTDGKDGYTPQIGVKQASDGLYYWTVDGEWLLDEDGNKIRTTGNDGKDGVGSGNGDDGIDGKDGITPRLKIENDYWYVSYDEGTTWTKLGKATGEDGISPRLKIENDYWYVSYDEGVTWVRLCKAVGNGGDGSNNVGNGEDGITPRLKIENGYWYVSYDDGETWTKLGKATGEDGVNGKDGEDGVDGKDGITPRLKIENDYWYVSYDEGATWIELGKATDENGSNGIDGDNFFKEVSIGDGFVIFTLNDGYDSQIKLPFVTDTQLIINVATAGTLRNSLTLEEQRSVTSLKVVGYINNDDCIFINTYLHSLEILDISDAIYVASNLGYTIKINPLGEMAVNRSIRHIIVGSVLGSNSTGDEPTVGGAIVDPSYCIALETITLTTNESRIASAKGSGWPKTGGVSGCPNLSKLIISEGVIKTVIGDSTAEIYCVCPIVEFPSTLEMIGQRTFGNYSASTIVCRAVTPPGIYLPPGNYADGYREEPTLTTGFYDAYGQMEKMILYVPAESIDVYKTTSGWSNFGTILPIEE